MFRLLLAAALAVLSSSALSPTGEILSAASTSLRAASF
jgi:hypothetical protein